MPTTTKEAKKEKGSVNESTIAVVITNGARGTKKNQENQVNNGRKSSSFKATPVVAAATQATPAKEESHEKGKKKKKKRGKSSSRKPTIFAETTVEVAAIEAKPREAPKKEKKHKKKGAPVPPKPATFVEVIQDESRASYEELKLVAAEIGQSCQSLLWSSKEAIEQSDDSSADEEEQGAMDPEKKKKKKKSKRRKSKSASKRDASEVEVTKAAEDTAILQQQAESDKAVTASGRFGRFIGRFKRRGKESKQIFAPVPAWTGDSLKRSPNPQCSAVVQPTGGEKSSEG